ncbi:MAG TPA: amidase [Steroidobacteraceae bacterium]
MLPPSRPTLAQLALGLASGRISAAALVGQCLANIASGEGARTFLKVHAEEARAIAQFHDGMRRRGAAAPGRYAGIPVSVKDLFDVAGDVTTAGSIVLKGSPPAQADATAITRLKAAGFIVIGRTNMTEFAYSGLGLNPHYGTPLSPWDRGNARAPGGSSSGAAVSISDAMAYGALGTDTGGSCRIPAAMCGVVGFKPTARRVPLAGTLPLSSTLDSIGPLANSVACCATLDAILAGASADDPALCGDALLPCKELRIGVLSSYVTDDIDPVVAQSYEGALRRLATAGVRLSDVALPELSVLPEVNRKGGLSAAEAYAFHRERLSREADRIDPRVVSRIMRGREQSAADYIELHRQRASFIDSVSRRIARLDAVLMPTIPIVPPALSALVGDEAYVRCNVLSLRNPSIVNFLDGCAISMPCHEPDAPPVGLTLFGLAGSDRRLLSTAAAVESCLQ